VRGKVLQLIMLSRRRNMFFRKEHLAGCPRLPVEGGIRESSFSPGPERAFFFFFAGMIILEFRCSFLTHWNITT